MGKLGEPEGDIGALVDFQVVLRFELGRHRQKVLEAIPVMGPVRLRSLSVERAAGEGVRTAPGVSCASRYSVTAGRSKSKELNAASSFLIVTSG
jgi:hypothetical protein